MKHDGNLDIAIGMSARSKTWKNTKMLWSALVERLKEENRTNETFRQFVAANKEEQGKIKDVGGYVGGLLRSGRRKPENVVHRQLLTLDIDFAHLEFWGDFCMQFDNAAVIHGTHKHCEASPRYRLVMPVSREVSGDEYVAISRRVAEYLNIDLFDNTTFETNRLMFWPSNPKDVVYYAEAQDGPWLDADAILGTYQDWTDSTQWPTAQTTIDEVKMRVKKQEDPCEKVGIIGAFCRTYPISEAVDTFLQDFYAPADGDRFTYKKGSTSGGVIVYDDKFAYSHHGTDPISGKLCNAFDLVRVHKFGHLDQDSRTTSQSFKAMEGLILKDEEVKIVIASESLSSAKYAFAQELEETDTEGLEWMKEMEIDSKGKYLSSANNINLIFANDPRLKGIFKQNDFDTKKYVFKNLPWRKVSKPEPIKNVDYSGVRNYIESIYGIASNLKIDDALILEFEKHSFHPIRDFLKELVWDGTERLDTLLIDYFGADDNIYTREAIRKTLVGAVARVMRPGVKFDLVLTLVGAQGTGKSTLVNKLGKEWFSDTFMTVHGKEALEQIQGAWLIEMAELSGLKKAEIEAVKHFISKQEDNFRPAYARASERYPRQCVFFGTTNNKDFLRDPSGNRRFMPIDIAPDNAMLSVFDMQPEEVNQIWAEAMTLYKKGEKLYLSPEAEVIAGKEQRGHSEADERVGLIEDYLDTPLPKEWNEKDIFARRGYFNDPLTARGDIRREVVCVAEVWCECLGKAREEMDRYKTRDINDILKSLGGWEQSKSTKNFKHYGKQKYYSIKKL